MSDDPGHRLARAEQLIAAGHHAEAETTARQALAKDPESRTAWRCLVRALLGQDRPREAMAAAREAVRLAPDDVNALLLLSHAASDASELQDAVEIAERAVSMAPADAATHYTLARALLRDSRRRTDALRAAEEAVRLAPAWPDGFNVRGLCLAELGRTAQAEAAFHRALALDPQHALAMSNLAGLDIRRKPLVAARRLTTAASIDPQESVIHANLAVAAHNFMLQLQWLVVACGLLEVVIASSGGSRAARVVVLAVIGALIMGAAAWFVAQLPRSYRRSPGRAFGLIGDRARGRLLILLLILVAIGAVAFGDATIVDFVGSRLFLFAIVGGVAALIRAVRRRR